MTGDSNAQKVLELRCFCRHHPLLGIAGRSDDGKGYVHIKVFKGSRLYTEVVVVSGTAVIRCRECFRWHRFQIVSADVIQSDSELPSTISV